MLAKFPCPGCHALTIMPMQEVFMNGNLCSFCGTAFSPHVMNWTAEETEEKLYAFVGEAVVQMARINKRLATAYQNGQITAKEYMEAEDFTNAKKEVAMRLEQILAADDEAQDGNDNACLQSVNPDGLYRDSGENYFGCP